MLGEAQRGTAAYLFATVTAPRDMDMTIGAGADWFMTWWLDGEPVCDTLPGGNKAFPVSARDHVFRVHLARGEHVLTACVVRGSTSFVIAAADASQTSAGAVDVSTPAGRRQVYARLLTERDLGPDLEAKVRLTVAQTYAREGRYAAARERYDRLLALPAAAAGELDAGLLARAHLGVGDTYLAQKDYAPAATAYGNVLPLDVDAQAKGLARLGIGEVRMYAQDFAAAARAYARVVEALKTDRRRHHISLAKPENRLKVLAMLAEATGRPSLNMEGLPVREAEGIPFLVLGPFGEPSDTRPFRNEKRASLWSQGEVVPEYRGLETPYLGEFEQAADTVPSLTTGFRPDTSQRYPLTFRFGKPAYWFPGSACWRTIEVPGRSLSFAGVCSSPYPYWMVAYAYTEVYSPRAQEAVAWTGSDHALAVWLNDALAIQHGGQGAPRGGRREARARTDRATVRLEQGWNHVWIKAVQRDRSRVYFELTDAQGEPLSDLDFRVPQVQPPEATPRSADVSGGRELHVAASGDDANPGDAARPLRTLSAAAEQARPGDVVTVQAGTYREWIKPPRGGASEEKRIVYRAAPGEDVILKGSERITAWTKETEGVWKLELPNRYFDGYNPYAQNVKGPWCDFGDWHHTGQVYLTGEPLAEVRDRAEIEPGTWYTEVHEVMTTIWVGVRDGVGPNGIPTEIHVRESVFSPEKTGIDYITVRGFIVQHAANRWSPPGSHQKGAIGPNWSRGWVIEDCTVTDARTLGVCLGNVPGEEWSSDPGHHVVRNNVILRCGQSGIAGHRGAVFSRIYGNHIGFTNPKAEFGGAETAAIKLHAPIDVVIRDNCIHNVYGRNEYAYSYFGIWLDWMAQGTRVSGNVIYNTGISLFMEVNHGPILVDNNLFMDGVQQWSEGCVIVHNLISGDSPFRGYDARQTPFYEPHTTRQIGKKDVYNQNDAWYNNVFVAAPGPFWHDLLYAPFGKENDVRMKGGLANADVAKPGYRAAHNVYYAGARPSQWDQESVAHAHFHPLVQVIETLCGRVSVRLSLDTAVGEAACPLITNAFIGELPLVHQGIEHPDGSPIMVDTDLLGRRREDTNPAPGPFAGLDAGEHELQVWPRIEQEST